MKTSKKGFTLAELLIVVAIIAVLVAVAIPVFNSQLEKSREAADLANVRAAYAKVMVAANDQSPTEDISYSNGIYTTQVPLKQKKPDWSISTDNLKLADVKYLIDTDHRKWLNSPADTCTISYNVINDLLIIDWGGEAADDFVMPEFDFLGNWSTKNGNLTYTPNPNQTEWKHAIVKAPYDVDPVTKGVTFKFPTAEEASKYGLDSNYQYRIGVFIVDGDQSDGKTYKLYEDLNSPIGNWGKDLVIKPTHPELITGNAKAVFQFYKKDLSDPSKPSKDTFVDLTEDEIKGLLSLYQKVK